MQCTHQRHRLNTRTEKGAQEKMEKEKYRVVTKELAELFTLTQETSKEETSSEVKRETFHNVKRVDPP